MSRSDEGRAGRGGIGRFFTLKKLLGAFFTVCLLGMLGFVGLYLAVDVPEGNADAKRQSNVYKYADGSQITHTGSVNREIVGLDRIPKDVQRTFVAAENKTFYTDGGIDLKGTARGLINTISGKGKQGGSTITQQYVKNYYLTSDQTVSRKVKELVIALKVDQRMSKDDILAGYINTSYYGRGAHGIQAAAQSYYGVDADDLTVSQGAYLAALLQAPSQYDWAVASDRGKQLVKERWRYVLNNMVDQGWLDKATAAEQKFPVPDEPKPAPGLAGQKGYLVNAANNALRKQLMAEGASAEEAQTSVEAGGWTMTLNIDKKKQRELERSVDSSLNDKLDPKARKVDARVQTGAASVDPRNGKVLALYGGRDYLEHQLSNATRRDYQAASTFKPLILASALENDAKTQDGQSITAGTVYDGTSERPLEGSPTPYAPPNEDDVDYGPVTVQKAMNKSINSVFAQMGVDVGMDKVMKTAGDLGMDVEGLEAVPAQTLGSMGASPLEMAGVYATFANHGKLVTPAVLKSAENRDRTVDLPKAVGEQVIKRSTADSVTSVLTGVVDDGTGAAVRNPSQDVAGKTGTSDDNKSAWFTGFTPKLVTSVGLFGEDMEKKGQQVSLYGAAGGGRVNGGGFPAQIWADYTFDVMGAPAAFDLDTDMGAGVAPPPEPDPSTPPEPEESTPVEPSTPAEPSDEPTSEEPADPEPSDEPTGGPSIPEPPEETPPGPELPTIEPGVPGEEE
ncbi:transglycosylase domain-containing protein [Streptomyces sp. EAG2]|uniref:transglycosylase domain-containing protein n=1 Tax=Streptomyces sp. EAG2 TaxID=2056495 RepID=UPI000C6D7D9B|nr:transglycosylase domain-containing protein [Streptomyces sp. EAG2]PKR43588.1 penicillin-binding protein [Streptomyces sp. EAG2]